MRHAAHRGDVIDGEAVALGVAGDVEPRDDLVVLVQAVAIGVAHESQQRHQVDVHSALERVERAVLYGEHPVSPLAEVLVLAGLGQVVVALDRGLGGLDVDAVKLGKQLVDGLALEDHGRIPLARGLDGVPGHIGVHVVYEEVLRGGGINDVVRGGEAGLEYGELLGPRGVEDGPERLLWDALRGALELERADVLVGEAPALHVEA